MLRMRFKGGVHPPDNKENTRYLKIEDLGPPEKLYIPLTQHIGAPNKPVVKKGDFLKMGQLIAKTDSFVSAPLHSPVSGVVEEVGTIMHPTGQMVPGIILQNNGLDELDDSIKPKGTLEDLSAEDIISTIKNAGIVGMGGASFPTHVKLSPPADKKIDCCIVNGAECEPYLTSDHRVMLESPEKVVFGLKAIMKVLNAKKGYIAIEDNKKDAYETLKSYVKNENNIQVVLLQTKYPQGSEKHLIKTVVNRYAPSGKLPMDVGVIVNNIDTCVAICNAIQKGMPLLSRVVTVSGSTFANCANFRVRIGTPISYIIEKVGGFIQPPVKLILGGPMMGISVYSDKVPVLKSTAALIALTEKEAMFEKEGSCLRCGKCVDACPMNLHPMYLSQATQNSDYSKLEKLHAIDCIECGACTYICPAKRHPTENIRIAKQKLIAESKGVEK